MYACVWHGPRGLHSVLLDMLVDLYQRRGTAGSCGRIGPTTHRGQRNTSPGYLKIGIELQITLSRTIRSRTGCWAILHLPVFVRNCGPAGVGTKSADAPVLTSFPAFPPYHVSLARYQVLDDPAKNGRRASCSRRESRGLPRGGP